VAVGAAGTRRRARREQGGPIRATETGRSSAARLLAIGNVRGARALNTRHGRHAVASEARAIVRERLAWRTLALRIGGVALELERLKARPLGDAETDEVDLIAAIRGVRAAEAIRLRRA
jgi:hypothetical protein